MTHDSHSIEDHVPTGNSPAGAGAAAGGIPTTGEGAPTGNGTDHTTTGDAPGANPTVADIIAEFSEVFAFARTRWMRFAAEVDPDLRGAGMIVLQLIRRKGPVTATGISQMLDMDKAVVSRQIAHLRELGLVDADPAPDDKRVMLLVVTERARELLDGIKARWAHAYHERFEGWSEGDLESLRSGLHRFNASADGLRTDGPAVRCARAAEAEAEAEADAAPGEVA